MAAITIVVLLTAVSTAPPPNVFTPCHAAGMEGPCRKHMQAQEKQAAARSAVHRACGETQIKHAAEEQHWGEEAYLRREGACAYAQELSSFLALETREELVVDRSAQGELLRINFNISFPSLSCEFATLDVSDALGTVRGPMARSGNACRF